MFIENDVGDGSRRGGNGRSVLKKYSAALGVSQLGWSGRGGQWWGHGSSHNILGQAGHNTVGSEDESLFVATRILLLVCSIVCKAVA